MKEKRPGLNGPENGITFSRDELRFLVGLMNGENMPKASGFGLSVNPLKNSISEKMSRYEGLEQTFRDLWRLPFVSEDMLSEREEEVSRLYLAGHSIADISMQLNITHKPVRTYLERAAEERPQHKDRDVPDIHFNSGGRNFGLIKAFHRVVYDEGICPVQVRLNPRLSFNESTTLLWSCTGRQHSEIAAEMKQREDDIGVYIKRASKKLGVRGRLPLIAATLSEVIKDNKRFDRVPRAV